MLEPFIYKVFQRFKCIYCNITFYILFYLCPHTILNKRETFCTLYLQPLFDSVLFTLILCNCQHHNIINCY